MLSTWLLDPVLGLSDTTRPLVLIGFVVLMFGVAGLAVAIGKRRLDAAQAAALSADTGSDKGAMRGADTTFSDEWLEETRNESAGEPPKQSWRDAILGPGALHHRDMVEEVAAAPAVVPEQAWAAPPVTVPAVEEPAWDMGVADEVPAPAQAWSAPPVTAPVVAPPVVAAPAKAPFLVDDFLDEDED